jgi:chromosome partitioning protein
VAVITFLNQKGGVGKTSICFHLAGTLAQIGRRILIVDADPQSSATQGFLGPAEAERLDPTGTIVAIYRGDDPLPEQVIRPTPFAGIDLLAGSQFATSYNVPDPHRVDPQSQVGLRDFLVEVRADYDLILVDCPPNLHFCSWAALVASDYVVVPLQAEDFGSQGLNPVQASIAAVRAVANPGLHLLGYLITMFSPRTAIHKAYEAMLRQTYGLDVFATMVPVAVDYKEAIAQRRPVAQYKPKGAAAKMIKALAEEIMGRIVACRTAPGEAA